MTALKDCGEFDRSFREIYSPEFWLKKENLGYVQRSFIDVMVTKKDKQLCSKLFDERESFQFCMS